MSEQCELCGGAGPMLPHFPRKGIVRCPECDLVFYAPRVDPRSLYAGEYFRGDEYFDYEADKAILQRNFAARLRELRRVAPGGRLLEIGCAYGFFLEMARKTWDARGIDISPEAVAYARERLGVNAECGDFLDVPDENGTYDVICLWDTIEHLAHPVRTLEKAARWLKPGGVLALTTGDIRSATARLRGERWRLVHPPTHLHYFSRATLRAALSRAGLVLTRASHVGYLRSLRGVVHGLILAASGQRAGRLGGWLRSLDLPLYLNLYDILLIMGTKPAAAFGED